MLTLNETGSFHSRNLMENGTFKQRRFDPSHYPIVVRQSGPAVRVINYDFGIELTEFPARDATEALFQVARMIQAARGRIAEKLFHLNQIPKDHPIPISTKHLLAPKTKTEISVKEVASLLGEEPYTIRRMADEGELKCRRTRKGHRRFLLADIEALLMYRVPDRLEKTK